jgi:MFS family permease
MTLASRIHPALAATNCFVLAVVAWGTVFYGHSVYMDALMRAHGWSASYISSAILLFWLASLPGTLSVGVLVDRLGPVPVVVTGGLLTGGGLALVGQITEPWQLFPVYAAMGFGYPALAATVISATLAPWFERSFGVALGFALTGASVGGALLPVIVVGHSAANGFPATMLATGGLVIAVTLGAALALALIGRPQSPVKDAATAATASSEAGDHSMRARLGTSGFWMIALPAAFGLGGQVGFLAHQVPMIAAETSQTTAAAMVTVVAVTSAIGRVLVGVLSRFLAISVLTALVYGLHGIGLGIVATADEAVMFFAGSAVTGLTVGAIVMLPPIIVRQVYGTVGFGRTYAMVNVVMYIAAALSPWVIGIMRDATGGYETGLWMLVGLEVAAAVLVLFALPRRGWWQVEGEGGKGAGVANGVG